MNQEIRKYLIDQCVKNTPVYYEDVGKMLELDLNNNLDRNKLSNLLGEISEYEYSNNRPLLSSIVIYKNKNDHGFGFYKLCEKLGFGDAKKLQNELDGFSQLEKCKIFWQKAENYHAFASSIPVKVNHEMKFFTRNEIDFLSEWGGKVYDKDDPEHFAAKNYIKNSLGSKTQYWSNIIIKNLTGLNNFNWRMWSQKGWQETTEGKKRVAKFKHYTWARIFRKGDDNKDIFFTVGVDGSTKELVYKLDYYFESNSHLNNQQKEVVNNNIPKELRWQSIPIGELEQYNWDSLLSITATFISEHLHVYDKLINLAWGEAVPEEVFSNFLRPQPVPNDGFSKIPTINPSFNEIEKDYIKESMRNKELGDIGEELVKQYEINFLKNIGYLDLVEKVEIVKDGKGYDILSFDQERNPKYIEVKATTGGSLTPFIYTLNEKNFAEENTNNYYIYRLFNYDEDSNSADFYIIKGINKDFLFQPISYRVFLKKNE